MLPRRRVFVPAALALLAAACDRPPTEPAADARRPRLATASIATVLAQDLGVLPGDERSEATYVTEDGVVYGRSYPTEFGGTPRFFRWTSGGGMVQVSSIPQPAAPPNPTLSNLPAPYASAFVAGANSKGEATGVLCTAPAPCGLRSETAWSAFRSSAGAGVRELRTRAGDPHSRTRGLSINRWGHVAGDAIDPERDDFRVFLWTPVDSFRLVSDSRSAERDVQINDIDQVIGGYVSWADEHAGAFVWRPDLGTRRLNPVDPNCTVGTPLFCVTVVHAQQFAGTLVVGSTEIQDGGARTHAALWRVPAVNRAGFPSVNANVYSTSSTLSLASSGGRYYQTYKATQATASGPYLELVDWGDGTSSRRTRTSIGVTTSQVHTYTKRGTYWVRVYVKDAQGRWGVSEHKVTISA